MFIIDNVKYCEKKSAPRVCSTCEKGMIDGYLCEGDGTYYCSDKCLYVDGYTPEQFEKDYADGDGFIFWTEWYDEADHPSESWHLLVEIEEN